jgi:uncharacterized lipoprotein YmbA
MKPAKGTKKKASARKAPKTNLNVNLEYVEQIADEAIATVMVLRSLVRQLAEKLEEQK